MTDSLEISDLIRDLRKRLNLTQEQFASRLGITFATVNRWERKKSRPSSLAQKLLLDLIKQMGKDGEDLLARYSVIKHG
ncbi:helix-turn-helix domain-containing protein [Phormidesmis sp. 146-33]